MLMVSVVSAWMVREDRNRLVMMVMVVSEIDAMISVLVLSMLSLRFDVVFMVLLYDPSLDSL